MKLISNQLVPFEVSIKYHGNGMPLHVGMTLNGIHQLCDDDIIDDLTISGIIDFDELTPFHLAVSLKDKTYAHTNLETGSDHWIELSSIKFFDYDLTRVMHETVYWADPDCEHHDPATMQKKLGSSSLGQNGLWTLGSYREPFFVWYHRVTHQGIMY